MAGLFRDVCGFVGCACVTAMTNDNGAANDDCLMQYLSSDAEDSLRVLGIAQQASRKRLSAQPISHSRG
jgi:hypothetical protein